jgi:hypothetical protein
MRSLGEGRWKSAYQGNSLAAYPTARTVWGEGNGTRIQGSRALLCHTPLLITLYRLIIIVEIQMIG